MKKYIFILAFLLGFVSQILAEEIIKYDVEISIQQNGELFVREDIVYDFKENERHGIFRFIPTLIQGKSRYLDIGIYDVKTLHNGKIEQNEQYLDSENYVIKIGYPDVLIKNKHNYTISYKIKKGVMEFTQDETKDMVNFNALGDKWQIPISNIAITIKLPKNLTTNNTNINAYIGRTVSTDTLDNIQKSAKEFKLFVPSLPPFNGITTQVSFPKNLLDIDNSEAIKAYETDAFLENIIIILFVICIVGIYLLSKNYIGGFKDKRAITAQYHPPKGLSLLMSGLVLDKIADRKDISPAIIELANLGYITITKDEKYTSIITKTDKKIENLTFDQEYILTKVLFHTNSSIKLPFQDSNKIEEFDTSFKELDTKLYKWFVENNYIHNNINTVRNRFLAFSVPMFLILLTLVAYSFFIKLPIILFAIIGASLIFFLMFGLAGFTQIQTTSTIKRRLSYIIFVIPALVGVGLLVYSTYDNYISFSSVFSVIFTYWILLKRYFKLGKLTQKGAYTQKHLLGLKEFIKKVNSDELKIRLQEDPLYLDKILPYAIMLGLNTHWMKFYNSTSTKAPLWYRGHDYNNMSDFSSSISSLSVGTTSGSSSSSGGGSGGGGGGSW